MLVISTRLLDYKADTRTFHIEASRLEKAFPSATRGGIDYENGKWCLRLRSHKTGKVVKFVRDNEVTNLRGELETVVFVGEGFDNDLKLHIHND